MLYTAIVLPLVSSFMVVLISCPWFLKRFIRLARRKQSNLTSAWYCVSDLPDCRCSKICFSCDFMIQIYLMYISSRQLLLLCRQADSIFATVPAQAQTYQGQIYQTLLVLMSLFLLLFSWLVISFVIW